MIDKYKFFKIIQNPNLIGIWFSILFAGLQFRIITFVLDKNFISSLQATEGVFNGTPHWRIYQSRFLGPILFEGSKYIFNDGLTSYILLSIFLIAIAGFIVWKIGDREGGTRLAFSTLCIFHTLFAFSLNMMWLYLWDYISVIIFLLFIEGVIARRSHWWFVGIWSVGIFNHENAVFIGTYLISDAIIPLLINRINNFKSISKKFNLKKLIIGFFLVGLSTLIVEFLRSKFLIEAIGPKLFGLNIDPDKIENLHFQFFLNISQIKETFLKLNYTSVRLIPIVFFILTIIIISILIFKKDPLIYGGFSINYLFFITCLLIFGIFFETRIFVNLIPLCIFATIVLTEKKPLQLKKK